MRGLLIYTIIGICFCFFQITGYDLAKDGNFVWSLGKVVKILSLSVVGGIGIGVIASNFYRLTDQLKNRFSQKAARKKWKFRQVFGISFLLLVLSVLPAYLAYYPGICAYDVTIQTGQIESGMYNDHHPLAHTLLMEGFMKLGAKLFGSVNAGIGLLTLLQVFLFAGIFALGITLLYQRGVNRKYLILLQIFGMFYPFHWYMNLSVIKDVIFSCFFLGMLFLLYECISQKEKKWNRWDTAFAFFAVGMQLFRNNGRYAMLALAVCLSVALILGKNKRLLWGKLLLNCMMSFVVGSLLLSGLFRIAKAEQGDRREMLSMPIQQLARTMLYHGGIGELAEDDGTMNAEDKDLINAFLLDESYREYRPEISDPVKSHTNTYVVRYRTEDFVRTYLHLLKEYPGDFINAALMVNAGYLYMGDESHATINYNGEDVGLGYAQTRWVEAELSPRGIFKASKWKWLHEKMEQWADTNQYLRYPILRFLFVPGTFLWAYMALTGWILVHKKYEKWLPVSLVFGYYATLFLGPTVQLRYLYPLMLALPFVVAYSVSESKGKEQNDECAEK